MAEPPVIDVDALVEDLRERVARARREGLYADDLSGRGACGPAAPEARVRFRPELAYSTKPVVGRPLTAVKKVLLRLLVHVFDDLARQADAGIAAAEAAARDARAWAEQAAEAEASARERVAADVAALAGRVDGLEAQLERLQVGPRLARLERRRRRGARARPRRPPRRRPAAAPSDQGIDYLAFEARFRGAEETVRERQEVYRRHLEGRRRAVDLGCGRGELLELMRDAGRAGLRRRHRARLRRPGGGEGPRGAPRGRGRPRRGARARATWTPSSPATSWSTCRRPWSRGWSARRGRRARRRAGS